METDKKLDIIVVFPPPTPASGGYLCECPLFRRLRGQGRALLSPAGGGRGWIVPTKKE